jgi:hypothetical protein
MPRIPYRFLTIFAAANQPPKQLEKWLNGCCASILVIAASIKALESVLPSALLDNDFP